MGEMPIPLVDLVAAVVSRIDWFTIRYHVDWSAEYPG
jgi:hypothetical protein